MTTVDTNYFLDTLSQELLQEEDASLMNIISEYINQINQTDYDIKYANFGKYDCSVNENFGSINQKLLQKIVLDIRKLVPSHLHQIFDELQKDTLVPFQEFQGN